MAQIVAVLSKTNGKRMKLYCEVLEGDALKFKCLVETVVFFAIVCAEFSWNCGGFCSWRGSGALPPDEHFSTAV